MRKLLVLSAVATGFYPANALAQAVSGGQAPQAGTEIRANPYNSTNAVDQYLDRKQTNNLPDEPQVRAVGEKLGPARPAKAAELTLGATVNDKSGVAIAKIDQVDADGVIVSTPAGKVKIPTEAFGHNNRGLLLDMTKSDFDKIAAKANASS